MGKSNIFYSLNEQDIQTVANQELGRYLSIKEISRIKDIVADRIEWYEVIAMVINEKIESDLNQ